MTFIATEKFPEENSCKLKTENEQWQIIRNFCIYKKQVLGGSLHSVGTVWGEIDESRENPSVEGIYACLS